LTSKFFINDLNKALPFIIEQFEAFLIIRRSFWQRYKFITSKSAETCINRNNIQHGQGAPSPYLSPLICTVCFNHTAIIRISFLVPLVFLDGFLKKKIRPNKIKFRIQKKQAHKKYIFGKTILPFLFLSSQ